MNARLLRGAVLAWLALLAIMFANGGARVTLLQPRLGEQAARQLASLLGVAVVVAFSYAYVRRAGQLPPRLALLVGTLWLLLRLGFEVGFGSPRAGPGRSCSRTTT